MNNISPYFFVLVLICYDFVSFFIILVSFLFLYPVLFHFARLRICDICDLAARPGDGRLCHGLAGSAGWPNLGGCQGRLVP